MIFHADSESDLKTTPNQVNNPILSKILFLWYFDLKFPLRYSTYRMWTVLKQATQEKSKLKPWCEILHRRWHCMFLERCASQKSRSQFAPMPAWRRCTVRGIFKRPSADAAAQGGGKNRIFDKNRVLTWFGLVLRSDSESA